MALTNITVFKDKYGEQITIGDEVYPPYGNEVCTIEGISHRGFVRYSFTTKGSTYYGTEHPKILRKKHIHNLNINY